MRLLFDIYLGFGNIVCQTLSTSINPFLQREKAREENSTNHKFWTVEMSTPLLKYSMPFCLPQRVFTEMLRCR